MTRRDPHPLPDALVTPAHEPMQLDPLSEAVHSRGGTRVDDRALPTMATTVGHPRWRWGRRVDPPANTTAPLVMSPSDLEPGRERRESSAYGDIDELRRPGRRRLELHRSDPGQPIYS